jgi:hypothetical protein
VNTVQINPASEAPDLTHPWWCRPAACTAGVTPDLSRGLRSALTAEHHKSAPVRVERGRLDDVTIVAYVASSTTEPIGETEVNVEVEFLRSDYLSIEGYTLTATQARQLLSALGGLLPAMVERAPVRRREDVEAKDCPAWCSRDLPGETHQRLVGDVELLGQAFTVEATQYGDGDPSVTFMHHADDNTSLVSLTVGEARELAYGLLGAAGLVEGGAR